MTDQPTSPEPTERDRENAAMREEVAAKQQAEYDACLAWGKALFGPGWYPSHRHMLVEKSEEERSRRTGERAKAAATVYTVRHKATGLKRHFTIVDAQPVRCSSMEEGFGDMLLEPDTTRTIGVRGEHIHPHRYSLCWSGYDLYTPRSAEDLAKLRVSRERGKAEREERKFQQDNPLLAWAERQQAQEDGPEGGPKSPGP